MPKHECFAFRFDATMEAGSVGEVMVYSTIVSWKWRPDDPEVTATDFDAALKKSQGRRPNQSSDQFAGRQRVSGRRHARHDGADYGEREARVH
jgi:hypothetical protein